jgi:DNA mismatch repair ATPase MutS
MESVLLRAMKSIEKSESERSQIQKAMVKVYVNDAFGRVEGFAKQAFAAIAEGDTLKTQLSALKKLTRFTPVNTIALRQEIADAVIKIGKYPF